MTARIGFVSVAGHSSLPKEAILRAISGSATVESWRGVRSAMEAWEKGGAPDVVCINAPHRDLFAAARRINPRVITILVTDKPMEEYSDKLRGDEIALVDHIIARRDEDGWTLEQLRVALAKIASGDLFGVEKYLDRHCHVHSSTVTGTRSRDLLTAQVKAFVEEMKLGNPVVRSAFGITEELLMNAIYDAPTSRNIKIDRHSEFELPPSAHAVLEYGCDNSHLAISVRDPFGTLRKWQFFRYLKKVMVRHDSERLIDTKTGGAGLGLFKILFSSHGVICNSAEGRATEVIALIDINTPLRDFAKMTRSIHFFVES